MMPAAAPYMNPRLAAIEHTGKDGNDGNDVGVLPRVINLTVGVNK